MNTEKILGSVSRVLLGAIFVSSGIDKLRRRERTANYMGSKNLPFVPVLLHGAAATEIGAGAALLLGRKPHLGAGALAAFLVPTTLIFHNFWKVEGEQREMELINFMKNVAILGGLLHVVTHEGIHRQRHAEVESFEQQRPDLVGIIDIEEERVA